MNTSYTPLAYAKLACDAIMNKVSAKDLPPKGHFHYHQGVFLLGMEYVYKLCKEERYFEYIKNWVDSLINENGQIANYLSDELDDIQPGILLFYLYERTGAEKYKIALKHLAGLIKEWNTNGEGGFWHKGVAPDQMWLDGIYMGGPFSVRYGQLFHEPDYFDLIYRQVILMKNRIRDEKTGLFYHGWDYSKQAQWANPETGLSSEFWGRAMGWYVMALLDIEECLPAEDHRRQEIIDINMDLIKSLLKYQDKQSGLWYQVVDKPESKGNWVEVSCSALYVYAICKAIRKGYLDPSYAIYARQGYQGVINRLGYDQDGTLLVKDVCIGTGISNYEYYINRPTSVNDLHGLGAFILMCCEYNCLSQEIKMPI